MEKIMNVPKTSTAVLVVVLSSVFAAAESAPPAMRDLSSLASQIENAASVYDGSNVSVNAPIQEGSHALKPLQLGQVNIAGPNHKVVPSLSKHDRMADREKSYGEAFLGACAGFIVSVALNIYWLAIVFFIMGAAAVIHEVPPPWKLIWCF